MSGNCPAYARILLTSSVSSKQGFSNFWYHDSFPVLMIIEEPKELRVLLIFMLLEIKIAKWKKHLFIYLKLVIINLLHTNVNNILVKIIFFKTKICEK